MNTQEEVYSILDSEHKFGTNRYIFTYSSHWRRIQQKALAISIRSVKQILSTRAIWLEGFYLSNGTNEINMSPDISLSRSWTELNKLLHDYRIEQYNLYKQKNPNTPFTSDDYAIGYEETTSKLNIIIRNDSNFKIVVRDSLISNDLVSMCGFKCNVNELCVDLAELSKGTITIEAFETKYENEPIEVEVFQTLSPTGELNSNNSIKRISFKNIWNRDTLAIHASFVDLSYHQWLGVCNEQYIPPKEYPITFDDQKFWIELFTLDGRPVELPSDNKDQIIIEAQMNSYI